jgi:hypothetical protein
MAALDSRQLDSKRMQMLAVMLQHTALVHSMLTRLEGYTAGPDVFLVCFVRPAARRLRNFDRGRRELASQCWPARRL